MNFTASLFQARTNPFRWLWTRLALAGGLAALADWLFFGRALGFSLPLFLAILCGVALAINPLRAEGRLRFAGFGLLAVSLAALVEEVNTLSFCLSLLTLAFCAILLASRRVERWQTCATQAGMMLVCGPFRLIGDALRALRLAGKRNQKLAKITAPLAWLMPALLLGLFLWLFASANPLIESWLAAIDLRFLRDLLFSPHPLFWLAMICAIWPMLHLRSARERKTAIIVAPAKAAPAAGPDDVFGAAAFLRTLATLNALFALQTSLDLAFLWGGLALPGGMSYAAYAHRGAYPLIVTALLAAVLVLFAMRPGGPAASSKLIRPLVLAFTGQNILLVISSLLRLNLYVAAYSLTYWRVAAFIWFLLVAFGLVAIVAQIVLDKPLSWLVNINTAAQAAMLYACCFVNFPWLIANYNVDHSAEAGGGGPHLDKEYLLSLGPQAIPAIDRVGWRPYYGSSDGGRQYWAVRAIAALDDWRSLDLRTWRLQRYLDSNAQAPVRQTGAN